MGLFDASSHSSTSDSRQGAADQGKNFRGNNRYTESGSFQLDRGSTINSGLQFSNVRGGVSFTSDPAVVSAALGALTSTTQQFNDSLANLISANQKESADQAANTTSLLTNALGKLSSLDLNAQTGGDSSRNNIVLYVMLGLLAVVAIMFWRRG